MKALFVVSREQAKKVKLASDKACTFGDKIYLVIEDNAQIPGHPIKEAAQTFNTTFTIA